MHMQQTVVSWVAKRLDIFHADQPILSKVSSYSIQYKVILKPVYLGQ